MARGGAIESLTISQNRDSVLITDAAGTERHLVVDGKKYEIETPYGSTLTTKARWKKSRLIVKTVTERGELSETYELEPETGRLLVKVRMKMGGPIGTMTLNRVYDRSTASDS